VLLFWVIVKDGIGPKASALHLFFALIVSVFWLVCRLSTVAAFNKGIAKTPSAKAFFLLRRQLSSAHLPGTQMLAKMNIGFFSRLFMAFAGALVTGTRRLTLFFVQLVSPPVRMILAFIPVTYVTPRTPLAFHHPSLFRSVCTWTTSYTFRKIPPPKHYLNVSYGKELRLILWV
jgi:hypothetical protein